MLWRITDAGTKVRLLSSAECILDDLTNSQQAPRADDFNHVEAAVDFPAFPVRKIMLGSSDQFCPLRGADGLGRGAKGKRPLTANLYKDQCVGIPRHQVDFSAPGTVVAFDDAIAEPLQFLASDTLGDCS